LLREAGGFLEQAAGAAVTCVIDAADDVWPVLIDPHQMEVALLNLVVNARDAMPAGGTVTLAARNEVVDTELPPGVSGRCMVSLTVRDTGTGMTQAVLRRATERFFTTKAAGRGTGLGLPMVQELAVRAGGRMRIESCPEVGTTVSILLPAAGTAGLADAADGVPEAAQAISAQADVVILLVEANEKARIATADFLRDLGYTVIDAAEADTGFVLASALDRLDIVLADDGPPDGALLLERIRDDRPGTPILSTTLCAGAESAGSAIGHHRPCSHADIAAAVRIVLGRGGRAA
jgi:CheY-like chemotaxis protein